MRDAYRVPEPCLCGDPECKRCFPYWDEKTAENAAEEALERLEQEVDRVLDEIDAGDHDSDLIDSPFVDRDTVMRVARQWTGSDHGKNDMSAVRDMWLQIEDYAKDVAERRLL